jgi:uncharacterized protein (TIRG00374 family)
LKRRWQLVVPAAMLAVAVTLIIWRGPDWRVVHDAFSAVTWEWIAAAIGLNLLSVLTRALAWDTAIKQSIEPPHPRFRLVFSAFSVGLFANAVLPGRVGELARVAVLRRRLPGRRGATATLVGSVFAHRMFDLFPAVALVTWVLLTAKIPRWALTSIAIVVVVGALLFLTAVILARRQGRQSAEVGRVRELIARARQGLAIMRSPAAAARAAAFQFAGWICQLFAVWATMEAFNIHLPLSAAGLVLVLMNVATIFPLWPGNFGLVQIAIAFPLMRYGVEYAHGVAFGIGLQAVEASVGVGVGLIFLAREGLSYGTLREIDDDVERDSTEDVLDQEPVDDRTRVAG